MKWLLIYLICAIVASITFCYIVLSDNRDYFKTHRAAGVFSIISMGVVFPAVGAIVIAKIMKSNHDARKRIKAALDQRDKLVTDRQEKVIRSLIEDAGMAANEENIADFIKCLKSENENQ